MGKLIPMKPKPSRKSKRPANLDSTFWLRRADREKAVYGDVSPWTRSEAKTARRSLGLPSGKKAEAKLKTLSRRPALKRLLARA